MKSKTQNLAVFVMKISNLQFKKKSNSADVTIKNDFENEEVAFLIAYFKMCLGLPKTI